MKLTAPKLQLGLAAIVLGTLVGMPAAALELEGINFPERVKLVAEAPELVLNGAGLRKRAFFKVYVAGLYLAAPRKDAKEILSDKGPKRFSMTLLRDLRAQQLVEALNESIADNHSPAELEPLKPRLDEFSALLNQIGEAKTGTQITLDFVPGAGTRVGIDGKERGKPIAGDDFYQALMRIWLGDKPVDRDLKRALLRQ
jgi:hypothetical protein